VEIHFHALMTFVQYGLPSSQSDLVRLLYSFCLAFIFLFISYLIAKWATERIRPSLVKEAVVLAIVWVIMNLPALYFTNLLGFFLEFTIPIFVVQGVDVYLKVRRGET
jgi:hypothetical protein